MDLGAKPEERTAAAVSGPAAHAPKRRARRAAPLSSMDDVTEHGEEEWGGGVEAAMAAGKPARLRPLDARAGGGLPRLSLARASSRTAAGREGEQGRRRSGCWAEEGVGGERPGKEEWRLTYGSYGWVGGVEYEIQGRMTSVEKLVPKNVDDECYQHQAVRTGERNATAKRTVVRFFHLFPCSGGL
jgi:hypothetical protein